MSVFFPFYHHTRSRWISIAVALCHVLLKTYGPNDVLLLASLFAMEDKSLEKYYGSETKPEPTVPDSKGNMILDTISI